LQDPIPRKKESESPATRNRTRDHLIAAVIYSQMLYQLSYSRRLSRMSESRARCKAARQEV
jgi:hypothetical protein